MSSQTYEQWAAGFHGVPVSEIKQRMSNPALIDLQIAALDRRLQNLEHPEASMRSWMVEMDLRLIKAETQITMLKALLNEKRKEPPHE